MKHKTMLTWNAIRNGLRLPAALFVRKTMSGVPRYIQTDFCSCGPVCMFAIFRYHGIDVNLSDVCEESNLTLYGSHCEDLEELAEAYDFDVKWIRSSIKNIERELDLGFPPLCIRFDIPGFPGGHYSVIADHSEDFVEFADSSFRATTVVPKENLQEILFQRMLSLHLC